MSYSEPTWYPMLDDCDGKEEFRNFWTEQGYWASKACFYLTDNDDVKDSDLLLLPNNWFAI